MKTPMKTKLFSLILATTIMTAMGAPGTPMRTSRAWAQSAGQAPITLPLDPTLNAVGTASDAVEPLAGGSWLTAFGQRLELGPIDLGLRVAPRRPSLSLDLTSRPTVTGAMALYRLTDTDLRTMDIGLDLRLRWPSMATESTALSHLQPYVSLGPAVSVTTADDVAAIGRLAPRTDRAMSLGMQGALGLLWPLTKDASLFGEYRMIQDRSLGSRTTTGEFGVDLSYGFSVRF